MTSFLPTLTVTDGGAIQNDPTGTGWRAVYHIQVNLDGFDFHPNGRYWIVCDSGQLQEITPDGMNNGLSVSLDIHLGRSFRVEAEFAGNAIGEFTPSQGAANYDALL